MTLPPAGPLVPPRKRNPSVIGPRLRTVLAGGFALFALLSVNAVYLLAVRAFESATDEHFQNWFYMAMFLFHLVVGLLLVIPALGFGIGHMLRARHYANRTAIRIGYGLLATLLLLLASGIVLTRIEGILVVKDPVVRAWAYWMHVITPLGVVAFFVLHRLAGKNVRWRTGLRWATAGVLLAVGTLILHYLDPGSGRAEAPAAVSFDPSLARTASGGLIPVRALNNNEYCKRCHADVHERWQNSVHRFSSFNNPAYLFSVRETKRVLSERNGDTQASRLCAGCHDPVPLFSGRFDDPTFNDSDDPTAQAGITCSVCHSISEITSPRGNADFIIGEPIHYPFTYSQNPMLSWVNELLIKSKPDLHRRTFLKPLHRSEEFCGTCHKVHLPESLNGYKWLRGQNHYDSFLLSGVSGHSVSSFYYPESAEPNCNGCHMDLIPSDDFGARDFDESGGRKVHDHLFPSANTAIPSLLGLPEWVNEAHRAFNENAIRIDVFGVKEGGRIDSPLTAPLRPDLPTLQPGRSYLVEIVIRTIGVGHKFTQGTTDSNQVWLDVLATSGDRVIGRSGGLDESNRVDPWSHFANVYMLDRKGNRIERRNVQDIFIPLYDRQIPPGAADVIHFRLDLPDDLTDPVSLDARLLYRKFDTRFMRHVYGESYQNELPILVLATDRVELPTAGTSSKRLQSTAIPEWERWNDYGIGLMRKGGKSKGELRQAEAAFRRVEELGSPQGPLNLARVYLAQGTVQDRAIEALHRASKFDPPAPAWTVTWFSALVNKQNGFLDEAISGFRSLVDSTDAEAAARGFSFARDYRLLNELAQTLVERARLERGTDRRDRRDDLLSQAADLFADTLTIDPENVTALYNLALIDRQLGDSESADRHFALYRKYKPDDNARDRAVATERARNDAADHAADAIVIYDLQRIGAFESATRERRAARFELRPPASPNGEERDRSVE